MTEMSLENPVSYKRIFWGSSVSRPNCEGAVLPVRYLDTAASSLKLSCSLNAERAALRTYANIHSTLHHNACTTNEAFHWARRQALKFFNADGEQHSAIFIGSGVTAGFNMLARSLRAAFPEKTLVCCSMMEHHSNDLPFRSPGKLLHFPLIEHGEMAGSINIGESIELLVANAVDIGVVTMTCVSNVTGIINTLAPIGEMCSELGIPFLLDAAQMAAHAPIDVSQPPFCYADAILFSGHKIYCPGSPGVIVARRSFLERLKPTEWGGGMVDLVFPHSATVNASLDERFHAGTPNIVGAIGLGAALKRLGQIGMQAVFEHGKEIMAYAMTALADREFIRIYGSRDLRQVPRIGAISFNMLGVPHELLARVLNDYFNIYVRNECFCAHPYVRTLIIDELWDIESDGDSAMEAAIREARGMVRASFGLYTDIDDVRALVDALDAIHGDRDRYLAAYQRDGSGGFVRKQSAGINVDISHIADLDDEIDGSAP